MALVGALKLHGYNTTQKLEINTNVKKIANKALAAHRRDKHDKKLLWLAQ